MGIIELHKGCPPDSLNRCWGPVGDYYTIFGINTTYLTSVLTLIPAIFSGIVLYLILYVLNKKTKLHIPFQIRLFIAFIFTIIVLFWVAYNFQNNIIY